MKSGLKVIKLGKGESIGFWAVNILKPRKSNKKERFIGYTQRYDIDGEGYQSEVWEATEEEK